MPAATVTNNATGVLASNLASGATSLTLQTGQGARFPTITGTNYFWATLIDAGNNIEIVKCTAHAAASDTFTIARAQQGTTAKAYIAGDRFEMRVTSEHFNEKVSKSGDTMTGPLVLPAWTPTDPFPPDSEAAPVSYINYAGKWRIDHGGFIAPSIYSFLYRANNGETYIRGTQMDLDTNTVFLGEAAFDSAGRRIGVNAYVPRVPNGAAGLDIGQYIGGIASTDTNEAAYWLWTNQGYFVASGLAGAGHWGLGNATDLDRFTVCFNPANYSGQKVIDVQTNQRYLMTGEANTTTWLLTDAGRVYAAGEGATGGLGNGVTTDSTSWVATTDTTTAVATGFELISAMPNTTSPVVIGRKSNGTWWGLGDGASGTLGGGVVTDRLRWTQITELPTTAVRKVEWGGYNATHDCFILFEDNTLWAAGRNIAGSQGRGTITQVNTYSQIASNVADVWVSPKTGIANTTCWYKGTDGVLYTSGENAYRCCLNGTTTDKTTFSAATDVPSGYTVVDVWPLISAELYGAFFSRWQNNSDPTDYRVYAIGYANDGTLGTGTYAAITAHANITANLGVDAADIHFMWGMHWQNANRKGVSCFTTDDGALYATGRLYASDNAATPTYSTTPFPHSAFPYGSNIFVKVNLQDG